MTLRILHVVESMHRKCGGEPVAVAALATAQDAAGLEVAIACHAGSSDEADNEVLSQPSPAAAHRIRVVHLPLRLGPLSKLVRDFDVVHVHGTWQPILALALLTAYRNGIAAVLTPHGNLADWPMSRKRLKKELGLAFGWRQLINRSGVVIALNANEARMIETRFPGIRVVTIPNGVAPMEIGLDLEPPSITPSVLFLAHLSEAKRPELAFEAFALVASMIPGLDLILAGPDKGAGRSLQHLVTRLGLEGRVRIVGGIYGSQKLELLRSAVCLCHPTRHEGCSMSILEALAAGVPVVTTREANLPSLERTGAGLIVESTAEAIAAAILSIAGDAVRRAAMSKAGRKLVRTEHSWVDVERKVFAAYQIAMQRAA